MAGSDLLLTFTGAVALLLWGVRMVRTGLLRAFGGPLRALLARAGGNRGTAFGSGLAVAFLMQSATAAILLVASFAGRGLVALPAAIAMALGADVGSTLVAQAFAFDIRWLWAPLVAVGLVLHSGARGERVRGAGRILIGLALMLLALDVMARAGGALRDSQGVRYVLAAIGGDTTVAVLLGALVTWLAHSSLAIVLLVMSLAAAAIVDGALAAALVVGANLGGALAPLVALGGAPVAARRVPLGNLLARLAIGIAVLPFLGRIAEVATALSAAPDRRVLVLHTLFNLTVAAAFLPLARPLAQVAELALPSPPPADDPAVPRHLDPSALASPADALGCAMRETLRVGDMVLDMLRRALPALEGSNAKAAHDVSAVDDVVDRLHEAIKLYLVSASKADLSTAEAARYAEILTFVTNLEHIGDIVDRNLMELAAKKHRHGWSFSAEGAAELGAFHAEVTESMRLALNVFATRDPALARRLIAAKDALRDHEQRAADRHYERLRRGLPQSIETSSIHLDVIRDLKRINAHLASAAYPILEAMGELAGSRLKHRDGDRA